MKLSELLQGMEIEFSSALDIEVTGIEYDSRKIQKGNAFICIEGYVADGHKYVADAAARGASVIIANRNVLANNVPVIIVEDTRKYMPVIAANFLGHPTDYMSVIGITGTNGKTTTTYLMKSILEAQGKRVGLIGTIEASYGQKSVAASRTTPESLDLHRLFKSMKDDGMAYVVMEVSSHALALGRVLGCRFKTGIFTNLTQDHLDFHKNMEAYRDAKLKLFYMTSHVNVINRDDEHGRWIMDRVRSAGPRLLSYGIDSPGDITARNIRYSPKGILFDLVTPEYSISVESSLPGKFNVYNCLAAAAAAYAEGIDKMAIKEGLKGVQSVPGRSQVVDIDKPFTVILDYAHTPDGLKNIIKATRQYACGRVITLFGCGGDRDQKKRPIMGELAGQLSDFCVITSDNPRSEDPEMIIKQIESGIKKTRCEYVCIENRKEAFRYALGIAMPGDVLLLAGKGHETYQQLKDKTIPFDEKEIVRQLSEEMD